MKNICFVIPSFVRGGVESVTLNILNSLDYSKYRCTLIICTGSKSDNSLAGKLKKEIEVISLERNNVRQALMPLLTTLKRVRPALVFSSFNHLSLLLLFLKGISGLKYDLFVRLNTLPYNRLKSNFRDGIYNLLFSKMLRYSKVIIAQSDEMRSEAIDFYRIDPTKVIRINNIVDEQAITSSAEEEIELILDPFKYNLIAVGSLGHVKGYDILLYALRQYLDRWGYDIHLYLIGDNREKVSNYRSLLENLRDELDLSPYVTFLGFQSNPYKYMSKMDAFVLSSRKEGFPNVVLESLVLGRPCLVTNCVDFQGVIDDGENGVIVKADEIEAMAQGIRKIQSIRGRKTLFRNFDYNKLFSE